MLAQEMVIENQFLHTRVAWQSWEILCVLSTSKSFFWEWRPTLPTHLRQADTRLYRYQVDWADIQDFLCWPNIHLSKKEATTKKIVTPDPSQPASQQVLLTQSHEDVTMNGHFELTVQSKCVRNKSGIFSIETGALRTKIGHRIETQNSVWMKSEYVITIGRQVACFNQFHGKKIGQKIPNSHASKPFGSTTTTTGRTAK